MSRELAVFELIANQYFAISHLESVIQGGILRKLQILNILAHRGRGVPVWVVAPCSA
jgi:hypothetical protein